VDRAEYLLDQLAALTSYGNGDDPRAVAIRAELATLTSPPDPEPAPRRRRKEDD
jgi:hypothetical protein